MKPYPFNWTEFHRWKNEIQNKTSTRVYVYGSYGFSEWQIIRTPSDKIRGITWTASSGSRSADGRDEVAFVI